MEVPKVLNTVHVVYFDSDSSLPSRMYKDTVGVVHLSAGQAITSPLLIWSDRFINKQYQVTLYIDYGILVRRFSQSTPSTFYDEKRCISAYDGTSI
jgi:hypothetical protein